MFRVIYFLYFQDKLRYILILGLIFQVSGRVASQTSMGYVIDDPTRPQDVGEAAKKFFNEGTNINCNGEWNPKCCPIFSINNHVLNWLLKPDKERYVPLQILCSMNGAASYLQQYIGIYACLPLLFQESNLHVKEYEGF